MSENIVALTNKKKNEIEFELEVEGLTVDPSSIRFIIETAEMDYAFKCKKKKGKKYAVTIPPLPQLEKTLYPFRIEAVIDGYHFTPMEGQVNVSGSFDVYASDAKNTTVAPPSKKVAKTSVSKEVEEKKPDADIAGLAKKVLGKKEEKKSVPKKKVAKKVPTKQVLKKKVAMKKEVTEKVNPLTLVAVEADELVKNAIQTLKESSDKIVPKLPPKPAAAPFFKKVTKKKIPTVVKETVGNDPDVVDPKEAAVHAILESSKEILPIEPVISFKKGKRVKT